MKHLVTMALLTGMALSGAFLTACGGGESAGVRDHDVTVIDPGHFHASLILKHPLEGLSDTVKVIAPSGSGLTDFLSSVEQYNEDGADWKTAVTCCEDCVAALPPAQEKGSMVVLSGNNLRKPDYILAAVEKGYCVLSDKPMCIDEDGYETLCKAYATASDKGLVIYDLMTERYDTLNIRAKEFISDQEWFGSLQGVSMKSIHHFYKEVSGKPLKRPEWYYDVRQQGEGIADVTTHLIDILFWQCFPGEALCFSDVELTDACHWPTRVSLEQFCRSTGAESFPGFLLPVVKDDALEVMSNGCFSFNVKGVPVDMYVRWDFEPDEPDCFEALYQGSRAAVRFVQDASTAYVKQLMIKENDADEWTLVDIPAAVRAGHEDHFSLVAKTFLNCIDEPESLPAWEAANTLLKYSITTSAVGKACRK